MSFAAWIFGERRGAVEEPAERQPLIPDSLAIAAGRGLDPPKKRTRRSKFAASLVFATLFCAGAALTAGAGNEVSQMDAAPLAESTPAETVDTTAPPVDEAAPVQTDEAAPAAEAAPVDPAPVDAATVEAVPVEATPPSDPAAPAFAPEPAVAVPAEAPDPSDATPAKAALAPVTQAAATAATKPAVRTAAKRTVRKAAAPKRHAAAVLAPIPFQALMFSPQDWLNRNPASATGASVVAISAHYLGVPYVWGGAVPATGFDCSGLTRFVYQQLGVQLPHYAASQFAMFPKLDPADLAPGDLVFFEPRFDGPGHVAIYVGGDEIIAAPHTGALVRYSSLSSTAAALGFLGAVRPYDSAALGEQQPASRWSMQVSLFAHAE